MKKRITTIIAIIFCFGVVHVFNASSVNATVITVPDEYSTIQLAINAANPGDTVFVRNGIYFENVIVNKTLSLVGESQEGTIIDGRPPSPVRGTAILIARDGVTVSNFTTANCGIGIVVSSSNNIISGNNIINNTYVGIFVLSSGNTLKRNYVGECGLQGIQLQGIEVGGANYNSLSENTIEWCQQGLAINYSSYNTATRNIIRNNIS